jgi:hypothetical protein
VLLTIQRSQTEDTPAGTYQCQFVGISSIETSKGKAHRWAFQSKDGRAISGLSDANTPPTTKNKTGRWLAALSGQPLNAGVSVEPQNYVGKSYLVIVSPAENGRTKLETFSAIPL